MQTSRKWYDNKGLMVILILFIYPIGFLGIWLRQGNVIKKIVYSIFGFIGSIFTIFFGLIAYFIINPTDHYEQGLNYEKQGNIAFALDEYKDVLPSEKNFPLASKKIDSLSFVMGNMYGSDSSNYKLAANYYNDVKTHSSFYSEAHNKSQELYFKIGEMAYRKSDFLEAFNFYQKVGSEHTMYNAAQEKIKSIEKEKAKVTLIEANAYKEVKSHVDSLIKGENYYSVILQEMDVRDGDSAQQFFHRYKIVKEKAGTPYADSTAYKEVSAETFDYFIADLGMEVLSKDNAGETKQTSPAGYNRYVGNTNYGRWNDNNVWEFYGKYAFMRDMLGYNRPIYYSYYDTYYYSYRGRAPYYGPVTGSQRFYGTSNRLSSTSNARTSSNSAISKRFAQKANFKSSINNRLGRSVATTSAGSRSSSSSSSRSSSRYSSSTSRSRSSSLSRGGK